MDAGSDEPSGGTVNGSLYLVRYIERFKWFIKARGTELNSIYRKVVLAGSYLKVSIISRENHMSLKELIMEFNSI